MDKNIGIEKEIDSVGRVVIAEGSRTCKVWSDRFFQIYRYFFLKYPIFLKKNSSSLKKSIHSKLPIAPRGE